MAIPESADSISPQPRAIRNLWRWLACRCYCLAVLVTLAVTGFALYSGVLKAREAARRSQCKGDLFYLRFAFENYHEAYGCFPPAYVADANGRPMHSWRVLILPFIDQASLYSKYRFDEPWDGPNNRQLATRIANGDHSPFHCQSDTSERGKRDPLMTSYLAVVGPGTAWQEGKCTKSSDIADDPEATLLLVEVADSGVHWMEPRDLHIGQMAPTVNPKAGQGISSRHPGGAHAATTGGHCRFLSDDLSAGTLHGLLTIRGGERIAENDF